MPAISLIILILVLLSSCKTTDPQYTTNRRRAINSYEQGKNAFDRYQNQLAIAELEQAIRIDDEFVEAWLLLGAVHLDENNDSLALISFEKAVNVDPQFFLPAHYQLGRLYFNQGKYEKALESFKAYKDKGGRQPSTLEKVNRYKENCQFALEMIANPVPFEPKNLGPNINSPYDEFINAMSVDETFVIFTVKQPVGGVEGSPEVEDFYYSSKDPETGQWRPRRRMSQFFNTRGNEGAMYISPDRSFLVFAACGRADAIGTCDLYISYSKGDGWTTPENMGERVNSRRWDSHPTIAGDSRTIYFVSNRSGGMGGSDIYKTRRLSNGEWSYPQNLGSTINTPGDEYYPFIHPDNNTLYFSSEGHMGMGGLDFFVSRKVDGRWQEPENLGYPINTHHDELGLQVNARGELAFISTDRLGGEGRFDIFSFELEEHLRPDPVTYMKGIVYDSNTGKKLEAGFELIDLDTEETVASARSDPITGAFLLAIPTDKNYALNVKRDGYLFFSQNFELKGVRDVEDPYEKDVPLQPIGTGQVVVLNNVFFETDKYELLDASKVELNQLVELLEKNPEINIEIHGHTDSRGAKEYNQRLSENRAKSVYEYLVHQGIDKKRLAYKGFGEEKPVADNSTPEGRALNRRTEFTVVD